MPSCCQPVLTTYHLCSCSLIAASFRPACSSLSASLSSPVALTSFPLPSLCTLPWRGASKPGVSVAALGCLSWHPWQQPVHHTSRSVRQGRPHKSIHQPTQWHKKTVPLAKKKIQFPALWSPFHGILCCNICLQLSTALTPLLYRYQTIAQAIKRDTGPGKAAWLGSCCFLWMPCTAELKTAFIAVQQRAWEDAHAGWEKSSSCLQKKKVSLESFNYIWTLVKQRCGELIKTMVSVFDSLPLSNIPVIAYLLLYLRETYWKIINLNKPFLLLFFSCFLLSLVALWAPV